MPFRKRPQRQFNAGMPPDLPCDIARPPFKREGALEQAADIQHAPQPTTQPPAFVHLPAQFRCQLGGQLIALGPERQAIGAPYIRQQAPVPCFLPL